MTSMTPRERVWAAVRRTDSDRTLYLRGKAIAAARGAC
jgi:hypothetical protein